MGPITRDFLTRFDALAGRLQAALCRWRQAEEELARELTGIRQDLAELLALADRAERETHTTGWFWGLRRRLTFQSRWERVLAALDELTAGCRRRE